MEQAQTIFLAIIATSALYFLIRDLSTDKTDNNSDI
jgi:hypothetical protein